MLIEVVV